MARKKGGPVKKPRAKKAPSPQPKPHRGRIQAQSQYPADPCEKSVAWGRDEPPTRADMLTHAEQAIRLNCREQAVQFINNAPAEGVEARLSISFRNHAMRGSVRIDIEVQAGRACAG
jgi:hypothetical protein